MHSTLQEIRLVQRSLSSSCRYCAARNQSPRRAFHRSATFRNSQEPGSNPSGDSAPAGAGKDDAEKRESTNKDANKSVAPRLPVTAPSLNRAQAGPSESEPGQAPAFYGSGFNRRQRLRAQQDVVDPPFVPPQWFVDNNVKHWAEAVSETLKIDTRSECDAWPPGHVVGASGGNDGADEPLPNTAVKLSSLGLGPSEISLEGSSTIDLAENLESPATPRGRNTRYLISNAEWNEVLTTTRGLLRTTISNSHHLHEPAVRANNLILTYAGESGEYLLDELVRFTAAESGSNVLTLDVQDIADLTSQARARDPSAAEARMLSYDILASTELKTESVDREESTDDVFDRFGNDAADAEDSFPESAGPPSIMFGKPIAIDLTNLGSLFGSKAGSGRRSPDMGSWFANRRSKRFQLDSQNDRMFSPQPGPFQSLAEGLLRSLTGKPRNTELETELGPLRTRILDDRGLPRESTIIHIKDLKNIQNTTVGAHFLHDLYLAVEAKRIQGETIVIIGTGCEKRVGIDGRPIHHSINEIQRTPLPAEISRTIVISPVAPRQGLRDNLSYDRQRRISTINFRHVWQMMRVWETSDADMIEPFQSQLEAGFWERDFTQDLTEADSRVTSEEVWSFQYVHRLVSYMRGLRSGDVRQKTEARGGQITPLIHAVAQKLAVADNGKMIQTAKDYEHHFPTKSRRTSPREKPSAEMDKVNKIRKTASKHEKRLMSGVVEPGKILTTFDDVHAPAETIDALQTLTTLSLVNPEAFTYGVLASDRIPGLLLYGPPGTGKTLLAKAVARESGATMLEVSSADLNDMYVGEGEKNVKALFSLARKLSPCVVFLDEADAMFSARSANGRRVNHRELLNQFLKEWDGMSNDAGSAFLMVATNRPMDFDDAVLRRLPRRLLIDLPTEKDRLEILKIHLKTEQLAGDLDLADLAKRTPFYSGSDLKNLCVAAALTAVREQHRGSLRKGPKVSSDDNNQVEEHKDKTTLQKIVEQAAATQPVGTTASVAPSLTQEFQQASIPPDEGATQKLQQHAESSHAVAESEQNRSSPEEKTLAQLLAEIDAQKDDCLVELLTAQPEEMNRSQRPPISAEMREEFKSVLAQARQKDAFIRNMAAFERDDGQENAKTTEMRLRMKETAQYLVAQGARFRASLDGTPAEAKNKDGVTKETVAQGKEEVVEQQQQKTKSKSDNPAEQKGASSREARRVLTKTHFDKALEEISASVSEDMNSLKEIKKFDDVYGDKKGRKKRAPLWGFRSVGEAERVLDTAKVREEARP